MSLRRRGAQFHQGFVNRNARQPGGEQSVFVELAQICVSLHQNILNVILGVGRVTQNSARRRQEAS